MKCDELKAYIKPIKKSITGHTIVGQAYYPKSDVARGYWNKWHKLWLKIAEQFKEAE